MARKEHDREDLLRDARALVERVEVTLGSEGLSVVAGFRRDGCASFYFGHDRAYQFNSVCALRRAHADGLLFKSEGGRLASLRRVRTEGALELMRHDFDDDEAAAFLETAERWLGKLAEAIDGGAYELAGEVPEGSDVIRRVAEWLAERPRPMTVAEAPNAR